MTGRTRRFLGLWALLALATPVTARAGLIVIRPGTGYYTGVDAGVGPGGPALNATLAANEFQRSVAGRASTLIDFGANDLGLRTTANEVWSPGGQGLRALTQNLSYTPPAGYQYGLTNAEAINNNATLGFNVGGAGHFTFVPTLNAGTASLTIHSDSAFDSFGFYISGLGNQGGVVGLSIDGQAVPGLLLRGSSTGGVVFLGYVGNRAVHDLTIMEQNVSGPARDVFGVSGLRLIAAAPEPSALVVAASGLATLLAAWVVPRRKRADG